MSQDVAPTRRPPVDASMSLINELLHRPIDPGYAAAARRRREAGDPPARRPGAAERVALTVITLLLGLVLGTAVVNLRMPTDGAATSAQAREDLVQRIEAGNAAVAQRSDRVVRLRGDIGALASAPGTGADEESARAAALGLNAGAAALTGPGVRVTLDDAPDSALPGVTGDDDSGGRGGQFAPGRVVARDLQAVVNSLWQSGAEAVAVNGHRLTSTSAIRFAGQAILVNYRPLTRPYVISALGAPDLEQRFSGGDGGAYLSELVSAYGVVTSTAAATGAEPLTVPAGAILTPRQARPDGQKPSTGPTPQPSVSAS